MPNNDIVPINMNLHAQMVALHDIIQQRRSSGKTNSLDFVCWKLKGIAEDVKSLDEVSLNELKIGLPDITQPLLPLYSGTAPIDHFHASLIDFIFELLTDTSTVLHRVRSHPLELIPGSPWFIADSLPPIGQLSLLPVDLDSVPNWIYEVKRYFSEMEKVTSRHILAVLGQLVKSSKAALEVVEFRKSFRHCENAVLYNRKVVQWYLDDLLGDVSQAVHYGSSLEEWEMDRYAASVLRLSAKRGLVDYFTTFAGLVKDGKCSFPPREWQSIKRVQTQIYGHMKQSFVLLEEINSWEKRLESRVAGL